MALVASQLNVSSIGDTYTDVAGDTYAETASQTRITMGARTRQIGAPLGGKVGAGTGSFQAYNFTDSQQMGSTTTTSTSETILLPISATQSDAHRNDAITIRVKNSNAGATTTINAGGLMEGDFCVSLTYYAELLSSPQGHAWYGDSSWALIKTPSTGTITAYISTWVSNIGLTATANNPSFIIGAALSENVVNSRIPTVKAYAFSSRVTAMGSSNRWGLAASFQIKADNI